MLIGHGNQAAVLDAQESFLARQRRSGLDWEGLHPSGGAGRADGDVTLILRASIIERTGTVPEAGTLALVLLGMLALMRRMRRVAR